MNNDFVIRQEAEDDYRTVENLTREAFWNVYRPGCTEHFILHHFRKKESFIPELDLVMEKDGEIIGHVMYTHSEIKAYDGRIIPIMTFGPISIAPKYKNKGYGTTLLEYSIEKARELGAGAIAITGSIKFYGRLGFVVASTKGIHYAEEPRENEVPYFLIKELVNGFLDGVTGTFKDPEGYTFDEKEADAFDALFPAKEKLKLPGQLA